VPETFQRRANSSSATSGTTLKYGTRFLIAPIYKQLESLDQYFFRRYLRALLAIFLPLALTVTPILIPLNFYQGKGVIRGVRGLDLLGWSNVGLDHSDRYWAHVLLSVLITAHVCWVIRREVEHYVTVRHSSEATNLRTVLIGSIPTDWLTSHALITQLGCFPGGVEAVAFNRDHDILSRRMEKLVKLAGLLELAHIRMVQQDLRGTTYRTAVSHSLFSVMGLISQPESSTNHSSKFAFYHSEIERLSCEIEELMRATASRKPLSSAFVTFHTTQAAYMACQTTLYHRAGYMTPSVLPISPNDVLWDNINMSWRERTLRTLISNSMIALVTLMCVIPVAFAGLLSQLIYLAQAFTWLDWLNHLSEWVLGSMQGLLPPLVVSILLRCFSSSLGYLLQKQGILLRSTISLKLQDYYFFFLFTQVTLVVTLSAGLTTVVQEISVGMPISLTLAKNLPKASNYFLAYTLLQTLAIGANALLRLDKLLGTVILSRLFDRTVSDLLRRHRIGNVEWGLLVPFYTNLACIGNVGYLFFFLS
jgi:hypothetical protein